MEQGQVYLASALKGKLLCRQERFASSLWTRQHSWAVCSMRSSLGKDPLGRLKQT